jgi:hypothetical protein
MDAPVYRTEVCYPSGGKHGKDGAVNRRDFITLLGGAAATWPLAARACAAPVARSIAIPVMRARAIITNPRQKIPANVDHVRNSA